MDFNDQKAENDIGSRLIVFAIHSAEEVPILRILPGVAGMQLCFPILVAAFLGTWMPPLSLMEQSLKPKNDGRSCQLAGKGSVSMRPLWMISEYKVREGATWGEEEARKLLFKPLDIDATKITFDGQTCHDVIFEKGTVNAKEHLANVYSTTPQALDIREELIEVVKTNCSLPGFAEYIRLKDRRLIIHINGVFFYFRPSVNY
jgi:hypothetical protein